MGASLGLALRAKGLALEVVGYDPCAEALETAKRRGAIDRGTSNLSEAVRDSDLIVVAAPVSAIPKLLGRIAPLAAPDALVTDMGSVKRRIVAEGSRHFGERFVGGHPMSGSEESGAAAARSDLFEGAAWILAPSENEAALARIWEMVTALQARPALLEAEAHDRLVALISHLPHLLSFSYAATVNGSPNSALSQALAGGSFRDLTRVSASDKRLWRDIFVENRAALLDALESYETRLAHLKQSLSSDSPDALLELLSSCDLQK
jgi:prephenate dehydrogenase